MLHLVIALFEYVLPAYTHVEVLEPVTLLHLLGDAAEKESLVVEVKDHRNLEYHVLEGVVQHLLVGPDERVDNLLVLEAETDEYLQPLIFPHMLILDLQLKVLLDRIAERGRLVLACAALQLRDELLLWSLAIAHKLLLDLFRGLHLHLDVVLRRTPWLLLIALGALVEEHEIEVLGVCEDELQVVLKQGEKRGDHGPEVLFEQDCRLLEAAGERVEVLSLYQVANGLDDPKKELLVADVLGLFRLLVSAVCTGLRELEDRIDYCHLPLQQLNTDFVSLNHLNKAPQRAR